MFYEAFLDTDIIKVRPSFLDCIEKLYRALAWMARLVARAVYRISMECHVKDNFG